MGILSGQTVRIRAVEPSDARLIYEAENDDSPESRGCGLAPLSYQSVLDYALSYDADPFVSGGVRFAVETLTDATTVGFIDIYDIDAFHTRGFVGIYIFPPHRRKGFGKEAVAILCRYAGGKLGLHQLAAKVETDNESSIALFESLRFSCSSVLKDWEPRHATRSFADVRIYQKIL